ncbi:MAG: permease [Deltaproteobacteria bacterium]|nr:permease [Deltaproteobacteria bacterium]
MEHLQGGARSWCDPNHLFHKKGPALSLLLAGPALSLPSILVIYKIVGGKKTLVFCLLTVGMSTFVGFLFGMLN